MDQVDAARSDAVPDDGARARAIRARLPGQVLGERIEAARAWYGELYTLAEVRQKIAESVPRRFGVSRSTILEPLETYGQRLRDEILLKYDEADGKGIFSRFWIATPTYFQQAQAEPWLLGEISGADLYAVVARWKA